MKRQILLAVFFIFIVGQVSGFPASIYPVDRSTNSKEPGEFRVQVENNLTQNQTFRVSISSRQSSWFYSEGTKEIQRGEKENFTITVTPPENSIQQNYGFDVFVRASGTAKSRKLHDYISIDREFDLNIRSVSLNRTDYMPGETVEVTTSIYNTAAQSLRDYRVEARLMGEKSTRDGRKLRMSLDSGDNVRFQFQLNIPEDTGPGEKELVVEVFQENKTVESFSRTIEVGSERRIQRSESVKNKIFIYTKQIRAENQGNVRTNITLNETIPSYLKPIVAFDEKPDREIQVDGDTMYIWSFQPSPGEDAIISYTFNYWIPGVALVMLIIGLTGLKALQRTALFSKSVKVDEDGVKIFLGVENISNRTLKDVEVKDFIPDIASVEREFSMAKPVVRKTNNGTRLSWEIEELEPGDQRVFEYRIKPMVEVEGGITLPKAELEVGGKRIATTEKVNTEFKPEEST